MTNTINYTKQVEVINSAELTENDTYLETAGKYNFYARDTYYGLQIVAVEDTFMTDDMPD